MAEQVSLLEDAVLDEEALRPHPVLDPTGAPLESASNIKRLSNDLAVLLDDLDNKKAYVEEAKKLVEAKEQELLQIMQKLELQNFRTPRGLFYIRQQPHCRVVDEDVAFPYLEEIGLGGLIKRTVNAQSLTKDLKQLSIEGKVSLIDVENKGIGMYATTKVVRKK